MTSNIEIKIPFQGFYGSIHEGEMDSVVEQELEEHDLDSDSDWYGSIKWEPIFLAYAQRYVTWASDELELPSLKFVEIVSPREYNFETDRIFCTIDFAELHALYEKYYSTPEFAAYIKEQCTSRSGFCSWYSPDIKTEVWTRKLHEWETAQLGLLLQHHWNELDINELESLDPRGGPMSEIIRDNLPEIKEK